MRPYTEVAESARVSRTAHAKINWIFSHADGVQCSQIGYPPCYTLTPTTIPVVCPKFKCVQFDLTAIGLSPAAPPSAAYSRSPYMFSSPPPHTTRPNPFKIKCYIELFYLIVCTIYINLGIYIVVTIIAFRCTPAYFIIITIQFTSRDILLLCLRRCRVM